jgi:hypothetical protein
MNSYNSTDLIAFHEVALLSQTFIQASNDIAKATIGMNQFFSELNKFREEITDTVNSMAKIATESNERFSELSKFREAIDSHNSFIANLNASLIRQVREINGSSNLNANSIWDLNITPFLQPSIPFLAAEVSKFQFSELRFKYPKPDTSIPNVNKETQISSHDFPEISHPIKFRRMDFVIHLKFVK